MHEEITSYFFPATPSMNGALCADGSIDPELFHPESREETYAVLSTIRKLCNSCPARVACLTYALEVEVEGLWAGTTLNQRARINKGVPESKSKKALAEKFLGSPTLLAWA